MKAKILAAALIASGFSIAANAADSATLTVNASVDGICKFQASTATLVIGHGGGPIDPSSATSATGATSLAYKCTKGETPVFVQDSGLHVAGAGSQAVKHASLAEYMPYTLTLTPGGAGLGFGGAGGRTLGISGTIAPAAFQNVSAGSYADTVVITLTP